MSSIFTRQGYKIIRCGMTFLPKSDVGGCILRCSRISSFKFLRHSSNTAVVPDNPTQPVSPSNFDDVCRYSTRSHTCGELRREHVGMQVCLKGWVQYNRKKFLILRDAYGTTQVHLDYLRDDIKSALDSLTLESVVEIEGKVILRPEDQIKSNMATGEIEVQAEKITIIGAAPAQMPMFIRQSKPPTEQVKMRHRYLYLRYPHMQKNLRIRSQLMHAMREFLIKRHFVDVETPTLFRKTPGGAQEFVVPTQLKGLFYSLVQSPQQFKQLLMVGGLDRYFQIARCYRDESVRPDRQPEFTQLDIELSFVNREGIMSLIEELLEFCWPEQEERPTFPIPQMSYQEAMDKYGTDKPDVRFESKISDVSHLLLSNKSDHLQNIGDAKKLSAKIVLFPGAANIFKKDQLEELRKLALENFHSSHLLILPVKHPKDVKFPSLKSLKIEEIDAILTAVNPKKGDLFLLCLGPNYDVSKVLGAARVLIANALEEKGFSLRDKRHQLLWVVDFPLFEKGENGELMSAHHPFTQPHPDDLHLLDTEPLRVRGLHYDLVLNGTEVGGGSIRISNAQLQQHILVNILQMDGTSLQHLVEALSLGCPPHGGIALGLDRLISVVCGTTSIRDVIAFPKNTLGKDPMSNSPAPLTKEDAKLYNLPMS